MASPRSRPAALDALPGVLLETVDGLSGAERFEAAAAYLQRLEPSTAGGVAGGVGERMAGGFLLDGLVADHLGTAMFSLMRAAVVLRAGDEQAAAGELATAMAAVPSLRAIIETPAGESWAPEAELVDLALNVSVARSTGRVDALPWPERRATLRSLRVLDRALQQAAISTLDAATAPWDTAAQVDLGLAAFAATAAGDALPRFETSLCKELGQARQQATGRRRGFARTREHRPVARRRAGASQAARASSDPGEPEPAASSRRVGRARRWAS